MTREAWFGSPPIAPPGEPLQRAPRTFQLTQQHVDQHGVVCLDARAVGRSFVLHASRPGPTANTPVPRRGEVVGPSGAVEDVTPTGQALKPTVTRVDIRGPIEQRAGYYDPCGGWSDGHDAIAERMIAALELGDVVLVIDSPGGAHAGLQEAIKRVQTVKAALGRKVCVYADEMIGSAAYWWACGVGDEIYAPESAIVGSIGARGAHESIAGALQQGGIAVTYFAWPGEGKVAFAPELPLSDVGKQRGERDVAMAGEAFCAAVVTARGIDRDAIVELDADALPAPLALEAGLIDGLASLEDVMAAALADAGRTNEGSNMANPTAEDKSAEERKAEENKRAEEEANRADKKECGTCKAANEDDAKYCDECGSPFPGKAEEDDDDDDDDDEDDDDPPPSSKKGAHPPPPERAAHARGLADLAGLPESSSIPAIKAALIPHVGLSEYVMKLTETRSPTEARGALMALVEDAAQAGKLRTELRAEKRRRAHRERMDLANRLSAAQIPGYQTGDLFIDTVDEQSGKRTRVLAKQYAEMKLGTFKGLVESKLKNAPATRRDPFQPDEERARENGGAGPAIVTDEDRRIAQRNGLKPEEVAQSRRAVMGANQPAIGAAGAPNWSIQ